ncbi:Hypothetical protein PENO1_085660 [Penicillium occitanis (nom. inval.)]|nr:Hypothetical protein PENO1_085660 [Penicillium occitanis (nom. inval.)]PCG93262.1 hypothetical protein PENOC_088620 [Penicillium occitanis (nom. inval.)]
MNEHEGNDQVAVSLHTLIPSSLEIGLGYHTPLENKARLILSHMFSDFIPSYLRIYRDKWFPTTIGNTSAFDQMLATYAKHLLNWQRETFQDQDRSSVLSEIVFSGHVKTLAFVRLNLSIDEDDGEQVEKVITAIVALACYAHLCLDMDVWKLHMAAVGRIFEAKGFSLSPRLMALVEWVDGIGSYDLDAAPIFDSAHETTLITHDPNESHMHTHLADTDISTPLINAFGALRSMNTQLTLLHSALGNKIWQTITPIEIDRLVNPLVRMFLSSSARLDSPLSTGACIRSGALLYLAEFRRRSGISPVIVDLHLRNLSQAMMDASFIAMDPSLRIWLLTIGAIEEGSAVSYPHEDGGFFHRWLAIELAGYGITSLSEYKRLLSDIVWFDLLFDEKLNYLAKDMNLGVKSLCI